MAMTTQLPRGSASQPAATAAAPTGLPAEQLYTWLEWVQDDLRRLEARLDYLENARVQLQEQERLLCLPKARTEGGGCDEETRECKGKDGAIFHGASPPEADERANKSGAGLGKEQRRTRRTLVRGWPIACERISPPDSR